MDILSKLFILCSIGLIATLTIKVILIVIIMCKEYLVSNRNDEHPANEGIKNLNNLRKSLQQEKNSNQLEPPDQETLQILFPAGPDETYEEKLQTEFPILFRDSIYLECKEGWFDLIYKLSSDIYDIVKLMPEPSVFDLEDNRPHVVQIKEKFGQLRYYLYNETPEIAKLILQAESDSKNICESCGKPGSLISENRWLRTTCPECKNGS